MKGTYGTGGEVDNKKIRPGFWWEQPKKNNNFEDVGMDGRIASK